MNQWRLFSNRFFHSSTRNFENVLMLPLTGFLQTKLYNTRNEAKKRLVLLWTGKEPDMRSPDCVSSMTALSLPLFHKSRNTLSPLISYQTRHSGSSHDHENYESSVRNLCMDQKYIHLYSDSMHWWEVYVHCTRNLSRNGKILKFLISCLFWMLPFPLSVSHLKCYVWFLPPNIPLVCISSLVTHWIFSISNITGMSNQCVTTLDERK